MISKTDLRNAETINAYADAIMSDEALESFERSCTIGLPLARLIVAGMVTSITEEASYALQESADDAAEKSQAMVTSADMITARIVVARRLPSDSFDAPEYGTGQAVARQVVTGARELSVTDRAALNRSLELLVKAHA
jgi:hypothetical protein